MSIELVNTALKGINSLVNLVKDTSNFTNYFSNKSLADASKLTRVEPLTIISKDLINLEYLQDVNQSLLSIFSAYYLQAVSILTTINNVEVVKILDRLNPNRDETGFFLQAGMENISVKNLILESYKYALPGTTGIALEFDKENNTEINSISNLSVGKLLNVRISFKGDTTSLYSESKDTSGTKLDKNGNVINSDSDLSTNVKKTVFNEDKSVIVPIQVRLLASVIPNNTITHLLAFKKEDETIVERFHAWRSGRISFITDLIFCQDLINEYKKVLINDDTGTMQEIVRRVNNSKKFGLLTKNPSLVSASNLFVISETVAKELEQKLGGKLSNARIRDKAFENTYAMIIAVVDREWERVTFYTRGVSASTDLSIKEIKQANKNKSSMDIMDMLKSISMGSPMSF